MKLTQKEHCHNCNEYVTFEFDDITERQVIICPNCKHEHYRELDEGTILNIRFPEGIKEIKIAKQPEINWSMYKDGEIPTEPMIIEVETREVIGNSENGRAIVKPKEGEEEEKTKIVSNRRWGRDPRQ